MTNGRPHIYSRRRYRHASKKAPAGKAGAGLRALPKEVRNNMGFKAKRGGAVKKKIKKKKYESRWGTDWL